MLDVIPIARTQVDWHILLSAAKQLLGRSLASGLDARKQQVGDAASYLVALAELEREGVDVTSVLREAGSLLRNIHYSFLVTGVNLYWIATTSSLKVTGTERCAIVSGNLEEWRTAIVNGCTDRSSLEVRMFYDKCLLHFERDGLGQVWNNFAKSTMPDDSFKLEVK
jgi:hypothetical protein